MEDSCKELSSSQWKAVIDQLAVAGVQTLELFGGDVFIRPNVLIAVIQHANKHNIKTYLPTNGNLLKQEMAERLVDAGLETIYFSVDGIDGVHDFVRGVRGTFERVSNAIRSVKIARGIAHRPKIVINPTISALNIHGFDRLIPWAREIGADTVRLNYAAEIRDETVEKSEIDSIRPTPFFSALEEPFLLSIAQAHQLKNKIDIIRRSPNAIKVDSEFIEMLSAQDLAEGIFPSKKCYISRSQATVDPYGNLLPCPLYRNFILGNLKSNALSSIWRNTHHQRFMGRQSHSRLDICRHCNMGFFRMSPSQTIKRKYQHKFRSIGK